MFLGKLTHSEGKPLFTYQELSAVVESRNRQAVRNRLKEFEDCGEDFSAFLSRRKKLNGGVVETITAEILKDPFVSCSQLQARVNSKQGVATQT